LQKPPNELRSVLEVVMWHGSCTLGRLKAVWPALAKAAIVERAPTKKRGKKEPIERLEDL
jgi:hypothetical protein